jgi:hypothetical protein
MSLCCVLVEKVSMQCLVPAAQWPEDASLCVQGSSCSVHVSIIDDADVPCGEQPLQVPGQLGELSV